jgi:hypothetical protein
MLELLKVFNPVAAILVVDAFDLPFKDDLLHCKIPSEIVPL